MRTNTKLSLLVVLLVLATNVSCQEEDINKQQLSTNINQSVQSKYANNYTFSKDEIKLTSDNYVAESTLYIAFLEEKLTNLEGKKKALLEAIEKGDKKAEIEFNDIVAEENETINLINDINKNEYLYKEIPRPNPCPKPRTCFPKDFQFVVVPDNITFYSFTAYNSKNQIVGQEDSKILPLPNNKGLSVVKVLMNGYQGEGYVKIITIVKGHKTTYSIDVDIQ